MLSIVVPVYCGGKTLQELVKRIDDTMINGLNNQAYEIILVDDKSPDESFKVIKDLCRRHENVVGIQLKKNYGQQNATYCGLYYASGDVVITMDDDLQHDPHHIPSLLCQMKAGRDLVYGVFETRDDGFCRQIGSKLTARFFKRKYKALKGLRVSSFRAIQRSLIDRILTETCVDEEKSFIYLSCLLLEKSNGVSNVILPYSERKEGSSNYNLFKLAKLYLKLQAYYGHLSPLFEGVLASKNKAFEVESVVKKGHEGVEKNESHDAWWRNKSAVCH